MINSHRLLVRGHQVPYEKTVVASIEPTTEHVKLTYLRYKEYTLGGLFLLVFLIVVVTIKRRHQRKLAKADS